MNIASERTLIMITSEMVNFKQNVDTIEYWEINISEPVFKGG